MELNISRIDRALNPVTVAVIGDKGPGYTWLNNMKTFSGNVYSVQLDEREIPGIEALGITNYKSVMDIPVDVDYAVIAVPRRVSPFVFRDCIAKGVSGVGMFTSGFSESGTQEGFELQKEIAQMAEDAGIVLLGPNCMGLYNPKLGVRFMAEQPTGFTGDVSVISQSGGHAGSIAAMANSNGVKLNKVISFGNGVVLENEDWLDYFVQDSATRIIVMYIEGVRNGRTFFSKLKAATAKKPVIVWKGGQTSAGQRATSSHTGSLAESMDSWDAVIKQAGAIRCDDLEQVSDTLKGLYFFPPFVGNRVGLAGGTGGQSVSMTDSFSKAGMNVPVLADDSLSSLGEIMQVIGASYNNPIDIGVVNRDHFDEILEIWANDPNVDSLMMQFTPGMYRRNSEAAESQIKSFINLKKVEKPLFAVLHSTDLYNDAESLKAIDDLLKEANIPSYPTYDRAANSILKIINYYQNKR
jgi:acyl-CoA synthetase (NDP forming)